MYTVKADTKRESVAAILAVTPMKIATPLLNERERESERLREQRERATRRAKRRGMRGRTPSPADGRE